ANKDRRSGSPKPATTGPRKATTKSVAVPQRGPARRANGWGALLRGGCTCHGGEVGTAAVLDRVRELLRAVLESDWKATLALLGHDERLAALGLGARGGVVVWGVLGSPGVRQESFRVRRWTLGCWCELLVALVGD
ncbi:hypothetical protein BV898_20093, partial [Hypsibius exemplaris]